MFPKTPYRHNSSSEAAIISIRKLSEGRMLMLSHKYARNSHGLIFTWR